MVLLLDEGLVVQVHPACSPAGIQQVPLPPQPYGVPHVVRLGLLEALALPVPDALTVAGHLLALDAHLPGRPTQTRWRIQDTGYRIHFYRVEDTLLKDDKGKYRTLSVNPCASPEVRG